MVVPDWTPEVAKSSERAPHDRLRSSRINCAQAFRRHCRLRTAHELIALAPVSVLCGFCRVARFSPTDRFSGRIDCFDATIPYGSEAVVIQLSETVTMLNWQYVRAASDLDPENDVSPSGDAAVTAHQLLAIFGWETLRQTEVYTRRANRTLLAEQAMHLLVPREKSKSGA